jgi:hypothetical protein
MEIEKTSLDLKLDCEKDPLNLIELFVSIKRIVRTTL